MQLAPALAGIGRVTTLDTPVEVTRAGWGPFRRLCTEFTFQQGGGPVQVGGTRCLRTVGIRDAAAGGWRVRVEPEALGTAAPPRFAMLRRDDGTVAEVTAEQPGGTAPLSPQAQLRFAATARAALANLGLIRQRLAPGTRFALPEPREWAQQASARAMDCLPESRGTFAGRDVVVARCTARFQEQATPQATSLVEIAGRAVVDVETGVVVAQAYARRTETLYVAPGQAPRSTSVHILMGRTWTE